MCSVGISSALINLVVVVFPTPLKPHNAIFGRSSLWIKSDIGLNDLNTSGDCADTIISSGNKSTNSFLALFNCLSINLSSSVISEIKRNNKL